MVAGLALPNSGLDPLSSSGFECGIVNPLTWGLEGLGRVKELFNGNEYGDLETRNRIVIEAFKLFAYTQSEIAAHLELDKGTISKIVNKTNQSGQTHHNSSPDPNQSLRAPIYSRTSQHDLGPD